MACAVLVLSAGNAQAGGLLPSVRSRTTHLQLRRPPEIPADAELEANRARVGKVMVDPENIFDLALPAEDTSLFRLANRLHIRTRESTVRAQLLFQPGDVYRGRLLEESARILRNTRYLQDAQIVPVAYHDGAVDIAVVTHDVWTLNPGISFGRKGGKNTTGVEIEELNFLGTGSEISVGRKSGVDRTSTTFLYHAPQIMGTWWTTTVGYSDSSDGRTEQFTLEHPFYALDTHWATGFSGLRDERVDSLYDLGHVIDQFGTKVRTATLYGGWSRGLEHGWSRRLTAGFTYDDTEFARIVGETGPTRFLPANRKLAYPWVGYEWIQDDFETARNRDQIEKTEDVHLGLQVHVSLGYAARSLGADRDALIFTAGLSRGFEPGERQRLLFSSNLTGRRENGRFVDVLGGVSARYYYRQSEHRLLYLSASTDVRSHPDLDHQLLLGGDNGLRGYPLRYQAGEGRWLVTAEQRLYTNWYPFRLFNVGGAVFYDMGGTWGPNPTGSPSQGVLRDVGFGLRFGNSRSALGNVLHIDLAFPLDGDKSIRRVQFLVETQRTF